MNLKIDPKEAKKRIDEFIKQTKGLLELSYEEGKEEKKTMQTKLKSFAKFAFSDGEEKIKELYRTSGLVSLARRSPQEKQSRYEDSLKRKLRNLEAWKEQIELEESSRKEKKKVDKLQEQIEEDELESERRKKVAEQKYHGAVIELLDLQRDRIKEMEETSKNITEIKKGIEDIKKFLQKLLDEDKKRSSDE